MKRRKKMKKTILTIGIIALILFVVGLICAVRGINKQPANAMSIDTPYGTLYYPEEWNDYIDVEIDETDTYCVTFVGKVGDKKANLFSVYLGEEDGMSIGTLTSDEGEKTSISIIFHTLEETLDWSKEDMKKALEMRDAGNGLIEYLKLNEDFSEIDREDE